MTDTAREAELRRKRNRPPKDGKWYYSVAQSWCAMGSFDSDAEAEEAGREHATLAKQRGVLEIGQWEVRVVAGKPTKRISLPDEMIEGSKP